LAGKAWCCGGGSGGGGGLTAVTTADTPTVDLEGDGSADAPLTAAVLLAAAPNGLQEAADGLLVAPSADAGNTLAIGGDGRLFVPTPQATTVAPVDAGAPTPVGSDRSVAIDVTQSPAGTWNVGARLAPPWGQSPQATAAVGAGWSLTAELTVPETGIYVIEAFVQGTANVFYGRASADYYILGGLGVDGAVVKSAVACENSWTLACGNVMSFNQDGSVTLALRQQLNAGQKVQAFVNASGTYVNGDGYGASASLAFNKISD
jgi:hypothetical protein